MSLMMAFKSGCCCCNNTAPNCNCLASSITVDIPAWSYGSLSCPAQTVIAYKCCFTFGDTYFVYRATAINIGTTLSNVPLCTTFSLNTYFIFYILYSNSAQANFCKISLEAFIVTEDSYRSSGTCFTCVNTPLVIDATTACYGMSTNNICSFTNTFMTTNQRDVSWFTSATNCAFLAFPNCTNETIKTSTVQSATSYSNCSKPNSIEVKFGTTQFTMTIS